MKNPSWVVMTLLLAGHAVPAQSLNSVTGNKQLQLSLQNGLSSLLTSSTIDSVYFAKAGYQAGVEGNYYWNNFGLAGSIGYFSNGANRQAIEDFARKRRAPRDRMQITSGTQKGIYFFAGPAFQSSFNKWRLQSSLEGGLISKPSAQILIGDNASPDIVYYRNVFDKSNSFAWSAGLSISYALSRQLLLGINADYVDTRNDVVNYDIQRGNGREAKNISSQAGLLNTGVRLSYLFGSNKAREAGSGMATGKRLANTQDDNVFVSNDVSKNIEQQKTEKQRSSSDTCRCQDKVMDVYEMQPYVVEIQFATVQEARVFLDTYQPMLEKREAGSGMSTGKRQHGSMSSIGSNPLYQQSSNTGTNPLYQDKGNKGVNPLYESKRTISNAQGSRGIVQMNPQGQQAFYLLPSEVDLAEILSLEDGRVTVHVQSGRSGDPGMTQREAGSGLATGKRTYKAIAIGDLDGDGIRDLMLQSRDRFGNAQQRDLTNDANLTWSSMIAVGDVDGDGLMDYLTKDAYTQREAGSGLATGKRQHKPIAIGDLDGDGMTDMLIVSYGHEIKSPRDVATGQSAGRVAKIDAFTIKQGIIIEADLDGDGEFEPLANVKSPRDVATGQASGKRMAAKEDVYVWKIKYTADLDGDGVEDGFVYSTQNKDAALINSSTGKTFSLSLSDENPAAKTVEKATSGIKQTMQTQVLIANDNPPDAPPVQKAGISTSRSNIRTKSIVSCSDGSCLMSCEIELDGKIYSALITSRTKHDTAKNSIGNIR